MSPNNQYLHRQILRFVFHMNICTYMLLLTQMEMVAACFRGSYLLLQPVIGVQVQYRMHPQLSAFPNRQFYAGQLVDGVQAGDRKTPGGLPWNSPIVLLNTRGKEVCFYMGGVLPPL